MTLNLVKAIPFSWYYEPSIYELERRLIFRKHWFYAGHTREIAEPGCFLTQTIAGFSILIIRDHEGTIKAFHNFCRHRGAPLVNSNSGRLTEQKLVCHYHGWSYDLKGRFTGGPNCEALDPQQRESLGLGKIRLHVYRGLIFLNLGDEADAFTIRFAAFIKTIDEAKFPFESFQMHSKVSYEGHFNWKTWLDAYQECYHCPSVHPDLNRDFFLQRYRIENYDGFSLHSCERKAVAETGQRHGPWLWLYPNMGLNCSSTGFYTLQIDPKGPQSTRLTYTFQFAQDQNMQQINEYLAYVDKFTREDIGICEEVQKNYASGITAHGFVHPYKENGVAYFHQLIREALAKEADREHLISG